MKNFSIVILEQKITYTYYFYFLLIFLFQVYGEEEVAAQELSLLAPLKMIYINFYAIQLKNNQ